MFLKHHNELTGNGLREQKRNSGKCGIWTKSGERSKKKPSMGEDRVDGCLHFSGESDQSRSVRGAPELGQEMNRNESSGGCYAAWHMGAGIAEGGLGIRLSSLATTADFSFRILLDPNHTLTLADCQEGTKPMGGR